MSFVITKSDLPKGPRKFVQDGVNILWNSMVKDDKEGTRADREARFIKGLKKMMDQRFKPHWHVIMGEKMGFALKTKRKSSALLKKGPLMIIVYKSPGLDLWEPRMESLDPIHALPENPVKREPRAIKIFSQPTLESPVYTEHTERVIKVLKETIRSPQFDAVIEDNSLCARLLRNRLSSEVGTIWHVVVGPAFLAEVAEDRVNEVALQYGSLKILCYQHKQSDAGAIDLSRIFQLLPYLITAIFCFMFLARVGLCADANASRSPWMEKLCDAAVGEQQIYAMGGVMLTSIIIKRVAPMLSDGF